MPNFEDYWYRSGDGLRLYARIYPCRVIDAQSAGTVLCMHGLTRNSADFASLAQHLSQRYRVICIDNRGRGRSDYDPKPENYTPLTYVQDMFALLDQLNISQVTLVGTSLGGLMAFLMAGMQPQRVRAMVVNDIGPQVEPQGLARLQGYVGKLAPVANWTEAVAQARQINELAFPDFSDQEWLDFTHGIYTLDSGVPVLAYDPAIAVPIADQVSAAVPPDLWPLFESIKGIPQLLVRGASSDILATECVDKMRGIKPDLQFVQIANRGHAPTLNEVAARKAIDRFLG